MASRNLRARTIATATGVLLGLVVLAPGAAAQQGCPLLDPSCATTTTDETTTTVEDTTTTIDDASQEEEPPTTVERDDEDVERTPRTTPVETTSATVTVTTLTDVLIPGDGTEGAESTTTTSPRLASADGGLSDEQLIFVIVAGLTLVAVVAGVLTWRYWDATRPSVGRR